MTTINQKEYLKKYLGIGKVPGEKKKKKKKETTTSNRLKIIDDDADVLLSQEIQEDISAADEDAPQIVAVIDERPPSLRIDEQTKSNLWKPVGETDVATIESKTLKLSAGFKLNKQTKSVSSVQSDSTNLYNIKKHNTDYDIKLSKEVNLPLHKYRRDDNSSRTQREDDYSPLRNNVKREASLSWRKSNEDDHSALIGKSNGKSLKKDIGDDSSPPRRKNSDSSPPRKKGKDDSSPPRQTYKDDKSPPRRKYSGDDNSSPRRKTDDFDSSPPRKRDKKDNSPSRRKNREKDNSPRRRNPIDDDSPLHKRHREKDISPPRRNKYDDSSPVWRKSRENDHSPLRKRNKYDDSPSRSKNRDDNSPPRRRDKGRDISPPRKRNREVISPPRRKNHDFSPPRKSKSIVDKPKTSERPGKIEEKMKKTLDGKTAGLQNAKDLVKETTLLRQKEDKIFENMSAEVSGKGAATVVRGKKVRDFEEEARLLKREKETKEKYDRWGKGLKQVEDQNEKFTEQLHEMSKPLARYANDEDLEKYLKEKERDGDPMLEYIRKKKRKETVTAGIPEKPVYKGEFMPNRFGIGPGYRWDGVDRSNGYEKKWFQVQNSRKATQEEAFKWSTEDM